ncbi:MAG: carboxypeptidase-like regulatory domain-containing protein [Bacteroidia bacterium]|nr:carboxypeptidase-like regulatory domain-containing protein [Bacteroidia bacterium]
MRTNITTVAVLIILMTKLTFAQSDKEFTLSQSANIQTKSEDRGSIKGQLIDSKTAETLPGAIVAIEGTGIATITDMEGRFTLLNIKPGIYKLNLSFVSYTKKCLTGVSINPGKVTTINASLDPASENLSEVIITASLNRENTNTLLVMQKNNASVSDGISSESIKRTPDKNTSDVLKRVSGASIQENKFAIIRGLNDRYNAAYLNGAPLPSSESDRKAFSFDIFPANLLDNLIINKTATPDMPAEFAGGIIQINTKSVPDKNFQSINIGGGYNTITTGHEQLYYKGGKTDWLGIDDGARALPSQIPDRDKFPVTFKEQASLAQSFKNNWGVHSKKYDPNLNFQYVIGRTFNIKEKEFLGMTIGATYNRNYSFTPSIRRTYTSSTDLSVPSQLETDYRDKTYSTQTLAGILANFSVKIDNNNSLSFKNLYSINSDDKVIRREGTPTPLDINPTLVRSTVQWFTSNKIYTTQLAGEHLVGARNIKVSWIGSYSNIQREIPDLRRNIYTRFKTFNDASDPYPYDTMYHANVAVANVGPDYGGGMFFSKNNESIYSFRCDVSYSFGSGNCFKNEIKIGCGYQERARDFYARQLGYTRYSAPGSGIAFSDSLSRLPEDQIFAQQNMGLIAPGVGGFKLKDGTKPSDAYKAGSQLISTYIMLDNRYKSWLRIIWGARLENFTQRLNAILDSKKPLDINTTKIDILPSVNAIFSVTENQNIRLCYSQTLNRPEFRELAPFAFYDFTTQLVLSGNDSLKRALIHNYDLRYELYPGRGQLVSATGFYKSFINPIEQNSKSYTSGEITYQNVPKAANHGLELEYRMVVGALLGSDSSKFLNNLTLYSNFAYIVSSVDVSGIIGSGAKLRPLQGQSPYIFNAGILYTDIDHGFSVSAAVNRIGQRIAIVGNVNEPDIWEEGRTVIDIQFSKAFLKNKLEIKLQARDILAQDLYFFQDRNNNKKLDKVTDDIIWRTGFGPTCSFSISYKF